MAFISRHTVKTTAARKSQNNTARILDSTKCSCRGKSINSTVVTISNPAKMIVVEICFFTLSPPFDVIEAILVVSLTERQNDSTLTCII